MDRTPFTSLGLAVTWRRCIKGHYAPSDISFCQQYQCECVLVVLNHIMAFTTVWIPSTSPYAFCLMGDTLPNVKLEITHIAETEMVPWPFPFQRCVLSRVSRLAACRPLDRRRLCSSPDATLFPLHLACNAPGRCRHVCDRSCRIHGSPWCALGTPRVPHSVCRDLCRLCGTHPSCPISMRVCASRS